MKNQTVLLTIISSFLLLTGCSLNSASSKKISSPIETTNKAPITDKVNDNSKQADNVITDTKGNILSFDKVFALNEEAVMDTENLGLKITGISKTNKYENSYENQKPKDGMEYIIVSFQVRNTGNKEIVFDKKFKMVNSKGETAIGALPEVNQDGLALGTGEIKKGIIVFEEPIGSLGLKLQYEMNNGDITMFSIN